MPAQVTNPFLVYDGRAYSIVSALLGSQARGVSVVGRVSISIMNLCERSFLTCMESIKNWF